MGTISHKEKVNLLHVSDILLLPSRFEAFGIVFLESWICGTPVIGTTNGAMPSIIGDDGLLCKFGDVEDLKETIRRGLSDNNALKKMGKSGKMKVLENYTWDAIGKKAEKAILKKKVGKRVAEAAGVAAMSDAVPMEKNAYMVQIAKVLIKRSILACV